MMRSRQVKVAAGSCLALFLAASMLLVRQIDRLRSGATLEEVMYVSSPKFLKRASLGFDGLLADIYWTRAVQ